MNIKNLLTKLSLLVIFLVAFSANTFAATYYVSATNGNDLIFPGTQAQPFQTIDKALTTAANGDVIVIFTDTYNEAGVPLAVTKAVTFQIMQTPNTVGTVVLITNGLTINSTTGTKTVTFESGAYSYNLGTTAGALTLTAGTMNTNTGTVVIGSGATVTRAAGSLTAALTTTNVNVTYNSAVDIASGPELPANLGTGTLTINVTVALKTLTVGSNLTIGAGQIITAGTNLGNATFSGTVTVSGVPHARAIQHQNTGTVTFQNAVVFTHTAGTATLVQNDAGGTISLTSGITPTNYSVGLNNVAAGTIKVGSGTYGGPVNNNAGGTIELLASATFSNIVVSNNNAASIFKLNSNQLTLSNAAGVLTNGGKVISTTAATVGNGLVLVSGAAYTANGGGELPNLTITGKLTLGANTQLYGNFILNSATAGAFTDGGFVLSVAGSFTRTDNTLGNFAATGTLTFNGPANQGFNPGASLTLNNVIVNNVTAAPNNVVTMAASVAVGGNFTITAGRLNLADYNITMTTAAKTFNNGVGASYYTSTGNGYLIMQANGQNLAGAGVYSNLLINPGAANTVNITAALMKFSGTLVLYNGILATGANTFQLTSDNVTIPTIRVKVDGIGQFNNAGTVNVAAGVVYNLEYFGNAAYNTTAATFGGEWIAASINNLWINTTTGANVITAPNVASNIAGILTVNALQTMAQAGALVYTLSGANQAHNIPGAVTGITLNETGSGSSITGSTVGANAASVANLTIAVGAAGSFTSTNLKSIANLTNTSGTSTVTMNTTTAGITGNLTLTTGSLTLAMGSAAAQQVVLGTSTLTAGTLTLGSNISVTGQTTQVAGNLTLGTFNYTQLGSIATPDYDRTGTGTVTGTGTLVLDATAAAIDITNFTAPVTSFSVPNLNLIAAANGIILNNALTVSNSLIHTSGAVNYSNITLAGPTYRYIAGTIAGTFTVTNTASTLTYDASVTVPTFVINAPGGTVTVVNGTAGAKTITVSTAFTLTDGTLAMDINHLTITGTFTRVAGAITQGTGYLRFNNAAINFTTGTGFTIDNLDIQANATNLADNKGYTVNKNLLLTAGTLTNDEKLTIGNGALVTVNAGFLTSTVAANYPAYGGVYDVIYVTAGAYAAGDEIPATTTVLRNLTVNNGAAVITLTNGGTVNGILYLQVGNFTIPAAKTLTLVAGGIYQVGLGTITLVGTGAFTRTTFNLIYSDGVVSAGAELSATAANNLSLKLTGAGTQLTIPASRTISGPLTLEGTGASFINFGGARTLSVTGNVTLTSGYFVNTVAATTGQLALTGAAAQNFTVPAAGFVFPNAATVGAAQLVINNSGTDGVTLAGGNLTILDPQSAAAMAALTAGLGGNTERLNNLLILTRGVLKTGANIVVLWHRDLNGTPFQGFTRNPAAGNYAHVVGNVKKYLDATNTYYTAGVAGVATVAMTRVEFPVGNTPTSPGYYRPMAFQFNTLPTANFNLTVNHVVGSPAGTNGFPITDGSLTLANYPGFYWLVTSDLTLQPQVKYDIEAEAYGYGPTSYPEGIQNIRFLRRFDTDVNNPWLLQGGLGYDNSTNVDHAKIIVRSAEGAISTQGARFTYSQVAKAPIVTTANAAVTVAENVALTITWTKASQNLGGTATFGATPVWTATAPAVVPTNAAFNATTGVLTWTPTYTQAGVYTVKVTATDGTLSTDNTVTITVTNTNRPPSFTVAGAKKLADTTIKSNQVLTFTYLAIDPDTDAPTQTYSVAVAAPAPAGTFSINAATGVFTFTPVFGDVGKVFTFTVTATDPSSETTTTSANVTVSSPRDKGDVNADGFVIVGDATLILQHVVGLITITGAENIWAADIGPNGGAGDGVIGALDAARILFYAANSNTWPAWKIGAASGSVAFGDLKYDSKSDVITVPLKIENGANIIAASFTINIDKSLASLESIASNLPEGWQFFTNFTEDGQLNIALAGTTPLSDGNFANVALKLASKESKLVVSGNGSLNDELAVSLQPLNVRQIPAQFGLSQNYPNPFNPSTTIKYQLAVDGKMSLVIYDMLGRKVKTLINEVQDAGYYSVTWNGLSDDGVAISSGIYLFRIEAGSYVATKKMNYIK